MMLSAIPILVSASGGLPDFCKENTDSTLEAVGCISLHWLAACIALAIIFGAAWGVYRLWRRLNDSR